MPGIRGRWWGRQCESRINYHSPPSKTAAGRLTQDTLTCVQGYDGDSAHIFWTLLKCPPHPLKHHKTALGSPTYLPYTHIWRLKKCTHVRWHFRFGKKCHLRWMKHRGAISVGWMDRNVWSHLFHPVKFTVCNSPSLAKQERCLWSLLQRVRRQRKVGWGGGG